VLGSRPDHIVEVRADILTEVDGPMLRHGLQQLHGEKIVVPRQRGDAPDTDRLEARYEEFRAAS
jgi:putative restriction endonuclease